MHFHTLLFFLVFKDDTQLNSTTMKTLQDISQGIRLILEERSRFFRVQAGVVVDVLVFYQQRC